jgi:hypothetical protein
MTKYDVGVLSRGDQVLASGRLGKIASVHEPKWVDHKTKRHMHEFHGADVTFNDGGATYFHAKDLNVFGTTTTNRPPSCDLPPEFYQPTLKPCPFCGSENVRLHEDTSGDRAPQLYRWGVGCFDCSENDYHLKHDAIGIWNSIPRRSDVMELLRLVETTEKDLRLSKLYERFKLVVVFANKLRKEMGD